MGLQQSPERLFFKQDGRVQLMLKERTFKTQNYMYLTDAAAGWDAIGNGYPATGTEFVVTCGCDGVVSPTPTTTTSSAATAAPMGRGLDMTPAPAGNSSTPAVAPGRTPAPAATSPIPTSSTSSSPGAAGSPDACTEASITVTSSEFPLLEGCLLETDLEVLEGGESEYVGGQAGLIYAGGLEGEEDVSARARVFFMCGFCGCLWHAASVYVIFSL